MALTLAPPSQIQTAVAGLDAWLDTMRCAQGYGGPVVHWWQQSLIYTGAAIDWRYEGIIAGYLHLWQRTGDTGWLAKAVRAGDDVVAGQLPNGHYAASAFELNPATAGTPHEAACDIGLLLLARALRAAGRKDWQHYAACAQWNVQAFYIDQLWDEAAQSFRDSVQVPSFVPNKAAAASEALFLLAELTGDSVWVERYALPILDRILDHQLRTGDRRDGAIVQNSFGARKVNKYFPIYIARCIPALLRGYRWANNERYADAALRAMRFISRWAYDDGTFPTVIYHNHRVNRYPCWIAPLGDVLRAADELRSYGFDEDLSASVQWLLGGCDASGGIQTARGFAAQVWGRPSGVPDVRDVMHVTGWCDKAFRYLAAHVDAELPAAGSAPFEVACIFRGQPMRFVETPQLVEVSDRRGVCYRWCKGEPWPEIASEEFWLR